MLLYNNGETVALTHYLLDNQGNPVSGENVYVAIFNPEDDSFAQTEVLMTESQVVTGMYSYTFAYTVNELDNVLIFQSYTKTGNQKKDYIQEFFKIQQWFAAATATIVSDVGDGNTAAIEQAVIDIVDQIKDTVDSGDGRIA